MASLYTALREAFGARASLAVHRHFEGGDRARIEEVVVRAARYGIPIVATNAVRYAHRRDKKVIDVLHCIREGMTLDQAGRALAPNAEAHLKSEPEMRRVFAQLPGHEEWLARSRVIAEACTFQLLGAQVPLPLRDRQARLRRRDPGPGPPPPHVRGGEAAAPRPSPGRARAAHREGARARRADGRRAVFPQRAVHRRDRAGEATSSARGAGARPTARSASASASRRSTPLESNLLFERFLSAERREPPDIDVDFEHERREEVIQAIYARYGRDRAAMVSEVISYRGKSALREVGKVFGFSLEQVDRLSSARRVVGPAARGRRAAAPRARASTRTTRA